MRLRTGVGRPLPCGHRDFNAPLRMICRLSIAASPVPVNAYCRPRKVTTVYDGPVAEPVSPCDVADHPTAAVRATTARLHLRSNLESALAFVETVSRLPEADMRQSAVDLTTCAESRMARTVKTPIG